jgi:hypothetical protein
MMSISIDMEGYSSGETASTAQLNLFKSELRSKSSLNPLNENRFKPMESRFH